MITIQEDRIVTLLRRLHIILARPSTKLDLLSEAEIFRASCGTFGKAHSLPRPLLRIIDVKNVYGRQPSTLLQPFQRSRNVNRGCSNMSSDLEHPLGT